MFFCFLCNLNVKNKSLAHRRLLYVFVLVYDNLSSLNQSEKNSLIDRYIDQYGAAIVRFKNPSGGNSCPHSMVFIDYDSSISDPGKRYTVLDPAATSISAANGVKFYQCAIYSANPTAGTYKYNFSKTTTVAAFY